MGINVAFRDAKVKELKQQLKRLNRMLADVTSHAWEQADSVPARELYEAAGITRSKYVSARHRARRARAAHGV
jgi:hypothetical protein